MKQKRTYRATYNGHTEEVTTARDIKWCSVGIYPDDTFFFTFSAQADPIKAKRAAKGTNPYISDTALVPVELVDNN